MESHCTPLGGYFSTLVTDQSSVRKIKIQAQMDISPPQKNLLLPTSEAVMVLLCRNIKKKDSVCVFPPMCKQRALGAIIAVLLTALGWRQQHIHYLKILMSGDKSQATEGLGVWPT